MSTPVSASEAKHTPREDLEKKVSKYEFIVQPHVEMAGIKLSENQDSIVAGEKLEPGLVICAEQYLMSYKQSTPATTQHLHDIVSTMPKLHKATLKHYFRLMFPMTEEQMDQQLRFRYKMKPDESKSLLKDIKPTGSKAVNENDEKVTKLFTTTILANEFVDGDKRVVCVVASKFNHSCNPNCVVVLGDGYCNVVVVRQITEGQECTISYTAGSSSESKIDEWMKDTKARQHKIYATWGFKCHCTVCADGLGEVHASLSTFDAKAVKYVDPRPKIVMKRYDPADVRDIEQENIKVIRNNVPEVDKKVVPCVVLINAEKLKIIATHAMCIRGRDCRVATQEEETQHAKFWETHMQRLNKSA